MLTEDEWVDERWADGVSIARQETGFEDFPETCPWDLKAEVLKDDWLPT
jgi:hypothetical protein